MKTIFWLICTHALISIFCLSCSRDAPTADTVESDESHAVTTRGQTSDTISANDDYTRVGSHNDLESRPASIADVTNRYGQLLYVIRMAEIGVERFIARQSEQEQREREWQKELKRLKGLYEQYSNRWEHIMPKSDLMKVAANFLDDEFARNIYEEFRYSDDPSVSASASRSLALYWALKGDRAKAMAVMEDAISHLFGSYNLDSVALLPDEHRNEISRKYDDLAMMNARDRNFSAQIEAARKSAITTPDSNPYLKATRYIYLAHAHYPQNEREEALAALRKAEETILALRNPTEEDEHRAYVTLLSIRSNKQAIHEGRLNVIHRHRF